MLINQVPNLNQYPVDPNDERFGFLPFVGGLAVGALAGGFGGPRPCGPACAPPVVWGPPMWGPPVAWGPPMWGPPMWRPTSAQTLPAQIPHQDFQLTQSIQTVQNPF